jgi:hypothetical protein
MVSGREPVQEAVAPPRTRRRAEGQHCKGDIFDVTQMLNCRALGMK